MCYPPSSAYKIETRSPRNGLSRRAIGAEVRGRSPDRLSKSYHVPR